MPETITSHTPGPWEVQREDKRLDSGKVVEWLWVGPIQWQTRVARVVCYENEENEQRSNARLIAAAPDLLEALKGLLPFLDDVQDEGPMNEGWKSDALLSAISHAETAIAAAIGDPDAQ